jgi:hypothetical protein
MRVFASTPLIDFGLLIALNLVAASAAAPSLA